jgi:hypothetical protein
MDQFVEIILSKKKCLKGQRVQKDWDTTKSFRLRHFCDARRDLRSTGESAGSDL